MCTVELAGLLDLDLDSLSLAALAQHWGIAQACPHDALDDARVLSRVLLHALARGRPTRDRASDPSAIDSDAA